jgi:hypothetical protein
MTQLATSQHEKSSTFPEPQICWFMLGLPKNEFYFLSELQNKICNLVICSVFLFFFVTVTGQLNDVISSQVVA